MSHPLRYETPENVQIEYRLAGVGTRFIAWFLDGIILNLVIFLACIGLVVFASVFDDAVKDALHAFENLFSDGESDPETIGMYMIGIAIVIWGLGSFLYFGLCELLLRGQTLGKRLCKIRVTKIDGFALDVGSVFVRNIFRVVDNIPLLWIVPVLSKRQQRFGDLVAGTIVISDEVEALTEVREQLSRRQASEARFRFDHGRLARVSSVDFEAVERILDRWTTLPVAQQREFLDRLLSQLCKKLQMDEPAEEDRVVFLEDLLAAEYRRQDRHLR